MDNSIAVIAIGTTNKCKVKAVEETAALYTQFQNNRILSYKVDSGVGEQPLDMETIVKGSKNRAENAMRLSVDGGDKGKGKGPGPERRGRGRERQRNAQSPRAAEGKVTPARHPRNNGRILDSCGCSVPIYV